MVDNDDGRWWMVMDEHAGWYLALGGAGALKSEDKKPVNRQTEAAFKLM
jgi:hypothetical protein